MSVTIVTSATPEFHARLRVRFGLVPANAATVEAPRGLAYCGRDFRVYPAMRIADAVRFYAALNVRWSAETIANDLAVAGLRADFEVKRMKRAYQRALVLAIVVAAQPKTLVVENAEEFDEPPPFALLTRVVKRMERVTVTYAPDAVVPRGIDGDRRLAAEYEALVPA